MINIHLKRTNTEREYETQLRHSHDYIFKSEAGLRLKAVLEKEFPTMSTAYVLGHTPGQSDDFYLVLIDSSHLLSIEIERFDLSLLPEVRHIDIVEYKRHLSKSSQIQLAVAMDLSKKDVKKT